jgi:hypothetical protein
MCEFPLLPARIHRSDHVGEADNIQQVDGFSGRVSVATEPSLPPFVVPIWNAKAARVAG